MNIFIEADHATMLRILRSGTGDKEAAIAALHAASLVEDYQQSSELRLIQYAGRITRAHPGKTTTIMTTTTTTPRSSPRHNPSTEPNVPHSASLITAKFSTEPAHRAGTPPEGT